MINVYVSYHKQEYFLKIMKNHSFLLLITYTLRCGKWNSTQNILITRNGNLVTYCLSVIDKDVKCVSGTNIFKILVVIYLNKHRNNIA